MKKYKWIATVGEYYQTTVGFGFFTKKDAESFARCENRKFGSGYYVKKVVYARNPKFLN